MAVLSTVLFLFALLLLADRIFFAGVIGLFVPAYAAVLLSFLGLLFAFLRMNYVKSRPRSKNKLKKIKRAQALMLVNVAACVAAAAFWVYDLIQQL